MKTIFIKKNILKDKWLLIDAKDKILGKLANKVSSIIINKNKKLNFNINNNNFIIIINSDKIKVTGKKNINKKYYYHTNFPGGLKVINFNDLKKKNSNLVIRKAILGMLPKNILKNKIINNIKIYKNNIYNNNNLKKIKIIKI
ncbi:putative 50S ribosomal subunit protein L13 [Candidatus Zinderia insecticola CARI]|uniref:Large ribosomal subunit protein uL13 n=1 Tax=Zinderia insecticola (strain CARI) TaxID=871271 RepID=E0TIQ8_ZINIC|nr:putative 50S ribosomal subunit protein L13 [Candidatus Zinderia insecticola CARI]